MRTGLSELIAKRRIERGLTQQELADKICVTRQSISKWENGQSFPETRKLMKLSRLLEVEIGDLLESF